MAKVPSGRLYMTDYIHNHGFAQNPSDQPDDVGNTQLSGPVKGFFRCEQRSPESGLLGTAPREQQVAEAEQRTAPGNPVPALTDADLMLKVKDGDDSAFEYLAEKYRRPMLGFMYRVTRNTHLAEELAQEVFLRVYRARATYNAEAKFSTWLYASLRTYR